MVTDVGDEMCQWQFWDVSDGFDRFRHQHRVVTNIYVADMVSSSILNLVQADILMIKILLEKNSKIHFTLFKNKNFSHIIWLITNMIIKNTSLFYSTFNYINFFELTINQFMVYSVRLIPRSVAHCVFFNLQPSHLRVLPRNLEI